MTSTSFPAILPPRSLTASVKPLRTCCPRAAAGPERVTITPILIFSSENAGVTATLSRTARPANFHLFPMTTPDPRAQATTQLHNQDPRSFKLILTQPVAASEANMESAIR